MNYRNPRVGDAEQIAKIVHEVMNEKYEKFDFETNLQQTKHRIKECVTKYSFVAEENSEIKGFLFANLVDAWYGTYINVTMMGVTKSARGKGIGTKLLELAVNSVKKGGFEKIELTVLLDNNPAINVYEKLGFKKTKYLMRKFL